VQQFSARPHLQINLTFPLHFRWFGDRSRCTGSCAHARGVLCRADRLADRSIVSLSPELFISPAQRVDPDPADEGHPERAAKPEQDRSVADEMRRRSKSRAETCDRRLLRNDWRVCEWARSG